jgi:hypothetical protein
VIHHASADFWKCFHSLPKQVQVAADRSFALLKADPKHPSLHFKKIDALWSARIGLHYRTLGVDVSDGVLWFWIGSHAEYDALVA